jgi:hypothetical protein
MLAMSAKPWSRKKASLGSGCGGSPVRGSASRVRHVFGEMADVGPFPPETEELGLDAHVGGEWDIDLEEGPTLDAGRDPPDSSRQLASSPAFRPVTFDGYQGSCQKPWGRPSSCQTMGKPELLIRVTWTRRAGIRVAPSALRISSEPARYRPRVIRLTHHLIASGATGSTTVAEACARRNGFLICRRRYLNRTHARPEGS